jgi:hypothetical protein
MPSLNWLKKRLTIVDNADNYFELSNEDSYNEPLKEPIQRNEIGISYLLNMAKQHAAKSRVPSHKYYPAWVDSLSEIINEYGSNEEEFLQLCLNQ